MLSKSILSFAQNDKTQNESVARIEATKRSCQSNGVSAKGLSGRRIEFNLGIASPQSLSYYISRPNYPTLSPKVRIYYKNSTSSSWNVIVVQQTMLINNKITIVVPTAGNYLCYIAIPINNNCPIINVTDPNNTSCIDCVNTVNGRTVIQVPN